MNQAPVFGTVQFVLDGEEIIADLRYFKIRRGYNLGDANAASSPIADFDLQPAEVMVHIGATRRDKPDPKL
jgi:hypothetical protein